MEILKFKECNITYAKDQPEYLQLPAMKMEDGEIVTCWKPSVVERLKIIFTGKIWLNVLTFNESLQPLKMSVSKPFDSIKKLYDVHKSVISGQCHNSFVRIQIGYTAIFLVCGFNPKGWQGLKFGLFAPAHNPEIGYRLSAFYFDLLPAMPGPPKSKWPKWYYKLNRFFTRRFVFGNGFK